MSSDQQHCVERLEEKAQTQHEECLALLYKKWEIELADYLAKLQIEQEEKYVYALAEDMNAWRQEIDLDCYSSDSCSFEEEEEEDDLEERIRLYKLDLRCNTQ